MAYVIGTNNEAGTKYVGSMTREAWDLFSVYYPIWAPYISTARHFETWIDAVEYRDEFLLKTGSEEELYIWEIPEGV